jgi:hypothetical protein
MSKIIAQGLELTVHLQIGENIYNSGIDPLRLTPFAIREHHATLHDRSY